MKSALESSTKMRSSSSVPIERQLLGFIQQILTREHFDLIVCGERKGTAVMRALIAEITEPRLEWPWSQVVSTSSMDQFKWSAFEGTKILLFEELVHHGRTIKGKKALLRALAGNEVEVVTAGFAVWEQCEHRPDYSHYASIDSDTYTAIRSDIIYMLQQYGSLLLDTEHVELSVRLECGINEFYSQLARAAEDGNTFSFLSSSSRLNLTIQEPDVLEPQSLEKWLIPGSNTRDVVQKCRIIERDHSHFSVMPIFYPNTKCVVDEAWIKNLPPFVDTSVLNSAGPKELFYLVGLLASIELLKGIVVAMSDLLKEGKIVLEIPQASFSHLMAMFPKVDMHELWKYVRDVVTKAKLERPRRSLRAVTVRNLPEKTLQNMGFYLLTRLLREIDIEDGAEDGVRGRSRKQLMNIAASAEDSIGVSGSAWGVASDRLIDVGLMVTTVEEITSSYGDPWAIRTFLPDSEIVSEKLRRQLAVKGSSWLPAI